MHLSVIQHYPNIVVFLYFDVDDSGANGNYDWRLTSSPEAIGAFKDMALDAYFNQPHTSLSPRTGCRAEALRAASSLGP